MLRTVDHDYERFSGYRQYPARIYDWYRRCYRSVQLTDIGRRDDVPAVDGEAQLQPERWSESLNPAQVANRERVAVLAAHIRQHGPVTKCEIGEVLGIKAPEHWIGNTARDTFVQVGRVGRFALYGLREERQ